MLWSRECSFFQHHSGTEHGHHACLMPWGRGRRVSRKTAGYWLPSVTAVSAISPLFQNQPLDVKPHSLTVALPCCRLCRQASATLGSVQATAVRQFVTDLLMVLPSVCTLHTQYLWSAEQACLHRALSSFCQVYFKSPWWSSNPCNCFLNHTTQHSTLKFWVWILGYTSN